MRTLVSREEQKQYTGGFLFPRLEIGSHIKLEWKYVCDICSESEVTTQMIHIGLYTGMTDMGDWPEKMSFIKWGLRPSHFVACDSHSEKELYEYVNKKLEEA